MSKRTFILYASFGTLVLSATHMPATLGPQPGPSVSSEHPPSASSSPAASFEQLSAAYSPASPSARASVTPPVNVEEPTLWLARAIYSETKLPHEQELVAWVIRNRVETRYRGKTTYRAVVLDPYQFSAFNPGSPKRSFLMQLGPRAPIDAWQQALWVAHYVRHADPVYRPFPIKTRHFYSERSMDGRRTPYWAEGSRFVSPDTRQYLVDERRFRFYK
ncbi:MAG: hypothetical protein ABEK84_03420, partial [Salinibacter sp.]